MHEGKVATAEKTVLPESRDQREIRRRKEVNLMPENCLQSSELSSAIYWQQIENLSQNDFQFQEVINTCDNIIAAIIKKYEFSHKVKNSVNSIP